MPRSKERFEKNRRFLLEQLNDEGSLLTELMSYGDTLLQVQMLARYYCLKDEEDITLAEIGSRYGCWKGHAQIQIPSNEINAVLKFLCPSKLVSNDVKLKCRAFKKKVERQRSERKFTQLLQSYSLVVADLPKNLPKRLLLRFLELHKLQRAGVLKDRLTSRQLEVLVNRYALQGGSFLDLESVGIELGISRQAVQQTEAYALKKIEKHLKKAL